MAQLKTRSLSKNVKIDPQEYVLQGSPLPLLCTKTQKTQNELCFEWRNLKREVCRKTSKQTLRNTLYRVPPSLYYLHKLQKHRTNSVLMSENSNAKFVEKHQNRPSGIRFTGVPLPLLSTKTPKTQNELCFDGRKLKHELCRKTANQTLRNTLSGVPLPIVSTKTPKTQNELCFHGRNLKRHTQPLCGLSDLKTVLENNFQGPMFTSPPQIQTNTMRAHTTTSWAKRVIIKKTNKHYSGAHNHFVG